MTQRHILEEQNPHSYLDADRRLTLKCHLKERRDLAQEVSGSDEPMYSFKRRELFERFHERRCSQ
jgi:hypothetical protein